MPPLARSVFGGYPSGVIAEDITELVKLFESSDLTELQIEQHGRKLSLRKGEMPSPAAEAPLEPAGPRTEEVKAHMVGTFYWTKDKRRKPPLALEQNIEQGQAIGFVEAMGIMNEIEAERSGRIIEIAVASGQPVEYGQTILVLQPE